MKLKRPNIGVLIVIGLVGMMLVIATSGLLSANQTLAATGSITPTSTPAPTPPPSTPTPTPIQTVGVSIYSDAGLTTAMSAVTWGTITPGSQTTVTIYIKNTGNTAETLSMTTSNYTPSNANTYLTCTWVPTVTTLAAGASTSATLTLAASSSATAGSFNFSITITGSQ
ncbi:MAG: hypothetical protein ABSA79_10320 [Candidatus Bathyarchaeia archaeon]